MAIAHVAAILVFDWQISKKSSPMKPSSQMNSNLVGSTYGRFCIKFRQTPSDGNSSCCLWQGELKKKKKEYCIKYFLPQVRIKLIKISINM
jgi:hypothetical protein